MVLFPDELHVSKSLQKLINKNIYKVSFNLNFPAVILACANQRGKNRNGTWITDEMQQAYINLHNAGWAHSVEVWDDKDLVGGLYGIAMGKTFFGESMFSKQDNASKIAFVYLIKSLKDKNFTLIDCQVSSPHLAGLGARELKRESFIKHLKKDLTLNSKTVFSVYEH
jgi:leucyl/phenylalanyl-tRNA---protein transferase